MRIAADGCLGGFPGRICLPVEVVPISNGCAKVCPSGEPRLVCRNGRYVLLQALMLEMPVDMGVSARVGAPYLMCDMEE